MISQIWSFSRYPDPKIDKKVRLIRQGFWPLQSNTHPEKIALLGDWIIGTISGKVDPVERDTHVAVVSMAPVFSVVSVPVKVNSPETIPESLWSVVPVFSMITGDTSPDPDDPRVPESVNWAHESVFSDPERVVAPVSVVIGGVTTSQFSSTIELSWITTHLSELV